MSVWDDIHGAPMVDAVRRMIESGSWPHAWLLLGPSGSGKIATATAIAAALNCTDEPGVGCGRCRACTRIGRHRHPDVHHVVAEGTFILVDAVRAVITEASRSPFEGRTKVFIFDEAERMNPAAQNALLKTLEEPESDTVFILLSAREEELLDTIRSRCRVVHLERLAEGDVVSLLEAEGIDHAAALLAARLSEGDVRRARAYAQNDAPAERRRLWLSIPQRLTSAGDAMDVAAEIGAEARDAMKSLEAEQKREVTELAEAMGEGRGTASVRNALARRHKRELRRLEEDVMGEALETLASVYRDALAVRSGGAEGAANLDEIEELRAWAAADVPDVALLQAVERCVEARGALARNANQTLALEAVLIDLARLVPPASRVASTRR
jgi:DNA polymerase-3 subunit delta'